MNRVKGLLVTMGLLTAVVLALGLLVTGVACGNDEASPETAVLSPEPGDTTDGQVSSSMMVPRPESIEVLVRMSHIIVLGTVSAVLDEKLIGAYGEDGNPTIPSEETGSPFTDYEVLVESVLKR